MASNVISIDFSKEEESGGGRVRYPEGDYHVKIIKAKATRSSEKDTPGIEVTFKILEGKKKNKQMTDTLWLTPKSLRRVRLLLEAVGVKVPKSAVNLPLKKLSGKTLWVELQDEEREGYDTRSRVAFEGFMSEAEYEAAEDEEDEDEDDDDLEDDDDEDEDDDDDDDEDEDDDEDDDDDEDEDEDDDDDDDVVEEPAKKRKKKGSAKSSKSTRKQTSKKKGTAKKKSKKSDTEDLDLDEL